MQACAGWMNHRSEQTTNCVSCGSRCPPPASDSPPKEQDSQTVHTVTTKHVAFGGTKVARARPLLDQTAQRANLASHQSVSGA